MSLLGITMFMFALVFLVIKSRSSFLLTSICLVLSLPRRHILLFSCCSWQCRLDSAFPDFPNSLLLILCASLADGCWTLQGYRAGMDWLAGYSKSKICIYKIFRLPFVWPVLFLCLSFSSPWVLEPFTLKNCAETLLYVFVLMHDSKG